MENKILFIFLRKDKSVMERAIVAKNFMTFLCSIIIYCEFNVYFNKVMYKYKCILEYL